LFLQAKALLSGTRFCFPKQRHAWVAEFDGL
jgi:hypothetical protein